MEEMEQRGRGGIVQGLVLSVDDTGEAQTVSVETHDGVVRSGIPVMGIHGLASHPSDGAICILLAVEGDQSNMVALPLSLPGARLGGLAAGAAALHDDAGNRIMFAGDGTGQIATADLMTMMVQALMVQAQGGATFRGPVRFEDPVTFVGPVTFEAAVTFKGHVDMQAGMQVEGDATVSGSLHVSGSFTHG